MQDRPRNFFPRLWFSVVLGGLLSGALSAEGTNTITVDGRQYLAVQQVSHRGFNWALTIDNKKGADQVDILTPLAEEGSHYRFHWTGRTGRLTRTHNGETTLLAEGTLPDLNGKGKHSLSLRRRPERIYIVADGRLSMEATDSAIRSGLLAIGSGDGRLDITRSRVQPVEKISFSDDFMRDEASPDLGQWSVIRGKWAFRSVIEKVMGNKEARVRAGKMPEAQRSANPFTFEAVGGEEFLATVGYYFWDDYEFAASVKTQGGVCGLAFHYRAPDDYFLFQWDQVSYRRHAAKAQLIKVTPEGRELLAERYVLARTEQWYSLSVEAAGHRIRAAIDRVPVFDLFDDRATGGMVGLYASADDGVFYDDVSVTSCGSLSLDRELLLRRYGRAVLGEWRIDEGPQAKTGHPGEPAVLHAQGADPSIFAVGDTGAGNFVLEAECRAESGKATPGMVFGMAGPKDYWLVRARRTQDRTLYELVQVAAGQPKEVASVLGPPPAEHWVNWSLDTTEASLLKLYVNDSLVLLSDVPPGLSGQIGVFSQGAARTDFRCLKALAQRERDWEKLEDNAIFANDPYMQGWASPRWAWVPLFIETSPPPVYTDETKPREEMDYPTLVEEEEDQETPQPVAEEPKRREYVHKGDFFGSFAIRVPVADQLTLSFGDEDPTRERGYAVEILSLTKKEPKASPTAAALGQPKVINPDGLIDEEAPDAVDDQIKDDRSSGDAKITVAAPKTDDREGAYAIRLLRNGEEVDRVRVQLAGVGSALLTVHRDGYYIWLSQDGKELVHYRDPEPLEGRRVRLVTYKKNDLAWVEVVRDHVKDYLFHTAPADWMKVGLWEVTNRFACDPRWSHLNGRSHSAAILWHKDKFIGDVTLEFYAGMRMRQAMKTAASLYYPRVGDLNATVCATGDEASSGYSFVLGAWDPLWSETYTRIMRRNDSVAETDTQLLPRTRLARGSARLVRVGWDPGGRAIHGAWYYVKIRRTGDQVKYYFDNHLALTFKDEAPLNGGRLGLWTYNNSMMVARVKISYDRVQPSVEILDPKPLHRVAAREQGESPTIHLRSPSHPGVHFDFEEHFDGWKAPNDDESAHLSLDPASKASGNSSLCLTNALSGGDFGAQAPVSGVDLLKVHELAFDYRIDPEAKINLYLSIKDDPRHCKRYSIKLNGEARDTHLTRLLRDAPEATADGKWHRFSMDLSAAFETLYPDQGELLIDKLVFGNFHEGYLNVGFGGNAAGATYHLDNFTMTVRGPRQVRLAWDVEGRKPTAYAVALTRPPDGKPDQRNALAASSTGTDLAASDGGLWFAHLSAQLDGRSWTSAVTLPVFVAPSKPTVVGLEPKDRAAWGGEPIAVTFAPGCHVSPGKLGLELNGQQVPRDRLVVARSRRDRTLTLALNHIGTALQDGEKARLAILLPDAEAGTTFRHEWTHIFRNASDKTSPSRVRLLGQPARFDFETPESGFEFYSEDAVATIDKTTAARGKASLRLFNMYAGSPFGVAFPIPPFHAGEFAILSFDYKVAPLVSSSFVLEVEGTDTTLEFTDSSSSDKVLGSVPGVTADNQWHHAEVDLVKLLSSMSSKPRCTDEELTVTSFRMEDQGYQGNAPRASIHLDNLELVPSVSSANGFGLKWSATDLGGVRGYSYSWSQNEPAVPEEQLVTENSQATFRNVPEGDVFLNIRAVDHAGNWGAPAHYRFRIDNTPPKLLEPRPTAEEKTAWRFVRVKVEETGSGLDVKTMKAELDGKTYAFDPSCVSYSARKGLLEWDWTVARGEQTLPVKEPHALSGRIGNLRDFAGNTSEPISWTWNVTPAVDDTPPLAPTVKSSSHSVLTYKSFAKGMEGCQPYASTAKLARVYDHRSKDYCLRVIQNDSDGYYGTVVVDQPIDVRKHPILSFEYRFRKNAKVYLYSKVAGTWYQFTQGPDIMADREWHLTWCDLGELFDRYVGKDKGSVIEALAITDYYYYASRANMYLEEAQSFAIDGIGVIAKDGKATPVFEVGTIDETGVSGYSYVLDAKYDKVADINDMAQNLTKGTGETIEGGAEDLNEAKVDFQFDRYAKTIPRELSLGLFDRLELDGVPHTGMLFLHIRARDGAGNWGPTTHYPYFVPKGTETTKADEGDLPAEHELLDDL